MKSMFKTRAAEERSNMIGNVDLNLNLHGVPQAREPLTISKAVDRARESCQTLLALSNVFRTRVSFTKQLIESLIETYLGILKNLSLVVEEESNFTTMTLHLVLAELSASQTSTKLPEVNHEINLRIKNPWLLSTMKTPSISKLLVQCYLERLCQP